MAVPNVSMSMDSKHKKSPKNFTERHARGAAGERLARDYLEARGLQCLAAGWRCRVGELDLVMRDNATLVFVEVRTRRPNSPISALESIDIHKQQRFVRAARAWLSRHPREAVLPARFDVILFDTDTLNLDNAQWLRDTLSVAAQ